MAFLEWMLGFMFVFMILVVVAIIFWLWMTIDCLMRPDRKFPNKSRNEKLVWILVLIFLNLIGAILYYFLVKTRK